MKQIEFNGRIYYYRDGTFFDEFFLILEGNDLRNVSKEYFKAIQWNNLTEEELFENIKQMKYNGLLYETKKVIGHIFIERANAVNLIHKLIPLYTSCCRELNQPEEAIKCAEELIPIYGVSSAIYTSLGAAYCDIKNYEKAKKCARIAYAKQKGGKGYKNELSLLFLRIRKETGENFFNDED